MGSSYLVIINEGPLMLWLIIWKDFLIVWLQKQIFSCCSDKWCPFCNLNPGTKKKKKKDRVLISGQKTFFQSHSWSLPLTRNSGNAASRQGSKGLNINHVELFGLSVLLTGTTCEAQPSSRSINNKYVTWNRRTQRFRVVPAFFGLWRLASPAQTYVQFKHIKCWQTVSKL